MSTSSTTRCETLRGYRLPANRKGGTMSKDPVCGMNINENQQLKSTYADTTYFFCSASCKAKFDKEPARFAKQTGSAGGPQGGHHRP